MEEIIKTIVEADKLARTSVEQKIQERHNIQNLIQEQSDEIKRKYQEETTQCVIAKRKELDEELSNQLKQEQLNYEEALVSLEKKYESHRQEWVKEIVGRCLDI